jgi:hypothetical protein
MSVFDHRTVVTKVTLMQSVQTISLAVRLLPMLRTLLLTLVMLAYGHSSTAEMITYEMSVWGINFGTMTVSRFEEEGGIDRYTLEASGKVNFLWMKREGSTAYEVIVKDGMMVSSSYSRTVNGEVEYWNEVKLKDQRYLVESSKGTWEFSERPAMNVLALYFNPITTHDRVYCEAESQFSTITKRDEDEFELSCSDGSRTTYHIVNGKLDRLEIHAALATVKIKRVYS